MDYTDGYLQGQFLIAAPGIQDERFERALLYLYRHDRRGAAGLVINKPSEHIDFSELCEQLSIVVQPEKSHLTLFEGGPVEGNRGYVLHTSDFKGRDTELIPDTGLSLTTTVDVIKRIADGTGPEDALMALGYASWEPGQLENEMTRHGWLYAKADMDVIFGVHHTKRWETVIERLGLNFGGLAEYTGQA